MLEDENLEKRFDYLLSNDAYMGMTKALVLLNEEICLQENTEHG